MDLSFSYRCMYTKTFPILPILDSIAISLLVDILLSLTNQKQIQIIIWGWDQQACLSPKIDKVNCCCTFLGINYNVWTMDIDKWIFFGCFVCEDVKQQLGEIFFQSRSSFHTPFFHLANQPYLDFFKVQSLILNVAHMSFLMKTFNFSIFPSPLQIANTSETQMVYGP